MNTPLIVGNWKMNTTLADAHILADGIRNGVEHLENVEVVLCPPTIWLTELTHRIPPRRFEHLKLGAQNIYFEEKGAYTGETSPLMVKEVAEYVIIGHSERRAYFKESLQDSNLKIKAAFEVGLSPIVCIGETTKGTPVQDLVSDLKVLINDLSIDEIDHLAVAYEPVWAIGTGNAAEPDYVEKVIKELKSCLSARTRLLYGGSISSSNAQDFLNQPTINGLLIGGASLKIKDFISICQKAELLPHI